MRYNDAGFLENVIGMPTAHKDAFLSVAREQKCVIMVRATGPTCHGPLTEGYDTKGYRIHGKSCDWGPMAGFVMRDPRLNKYGVRKEQFNRDKHTEALYADAENQGWMASTTALLISEARVQWLIDNLIIHVVREGANLVGTADNQAGLRFKFILVKDIYDLYAVCFDNRGTGTKWIQETGNVVDKPHRANRDWDPMLAMTNPPDHAIATLMPHLQAITGDYDLFAVWPHAEDYDARPGGDDHRPLGTVRGSNSAAERANVTDLENNFTRSGQGTKLGNITNRIYLVCQLINSIVGRSVLWHSDEAARPFLDDVDLPVIAFNPAGSYFGIETIRDFQIYINECRKAHIYVTLSNAWAQDPTPAKPQRLGGAYAGYVPADGVRIIVPDWYNR